MNKICLILIIACGCSCGFESPVEKAQRLRDERMIDSIKTIEREERKIDSIAQIEENDKQHEIMRLYASGKGYDALLLDGRISIDQYNRLKKLDDGNVKLNTGPTILDEVMDKYEKNLHTSPHLTH